LGSTFYGGAESQFWTTVCISRSTEHVAKLDREFRAVTTAVGVQEKERTAAKYNGLPCIRIIGRNTLVSNAILRCDCWLYDLDLVCKHRQLRE